MTAVGTLVGGKGARAAAGRVVSIGRRYGPTDGPMAARTRAMTTMLLDAGLPPTFPVPAAVLARRPALFASLAALGAEIAIHGLHHVDHLGLGAKAIEPAIRRATEIFERAGIAAVGFRAPYLRTSADTLRAVRAAGLEYDASPALAFPADDPAPGDSPVPDRAATPSYAAALAFQRAAPLGEQPPLPWLEGGLVRLPYALPDDEGLDRLGGSALAGRRWLAMLELSHGRGGLLCIGVHPERFLAYRPALDEVVRAAGALEGTLWRASLGEVAAWWRARAATELEATAIEAAGQEAPAWCVTARGLPARGGLVVAWPDGRSERSPGESVTLSWPRRPQVAIDPPSPSPAAAGDVVVSIDRWPAGARSALNVSGDVDAVSLRDFALRVVGR